MRENLIAAFERATADDLAQGLGWYELARDIADSFDGVTREQGAGVIAAMSPMMSWGANITIARRLIARYVAGKPQPLSGFGLGANVAKAWAILRGEAPLVVLRAPKTRSFYQNIMGDPDAVTIDRWAVRAAEGDPTHPGTVSNAQYGRYADAYREAAVELDVHPRELQAAVWVYYRRTHARVVLDNPKEA